MLFNSVISTRGAQFMTMDISNFYLMTPLHQPEFIRMKLNNIPDKIINEYKLMILTYLSQTHEVLRPDLRPKHQL
jgi:hypothetical protein